MNVKNIKKGDYVIAIDTYKIIKGGLYRVESDPNDLNCIRVNNSIYTFNISRFQKIEIKEEHKEFVNLLYFK